MDTLVALRGFHAGERRLFERLLNLGEDPFVSKKIMAFWLWLESVGYHDLLERIQSHSDRFLLLIAAEAETCLSCLEKSTNSTIGIGPPKSANSSSGSSIPITASLTEQPLISLSLGQLEQHRDVARTGISHIFNGVCALVFDDIIIHRGMLSGIGGGGAGARLGQQLTTMMMQQQRPAAAGGEKSSSSSGGYSVSLCGAGLSTISGHYNPWSRPFHLPLLRCQQTEAAGEGSSSSSSELLALHSTLLPHDLNLMATSRPLDQVMSTGDQEQRCLFVTFSRGYPLSRGEIIDFFTESWGDCVENVYVESSMARDGALYGRVIFRTREIVWNVLNGQEKVKFCVNGKPLWGRMYRPKRVTS